MSILRVQKIRHTASNTDVIDIANDGTATGKFTNRKGKNLIINGAMEVAQRGTSSTSTGYQTVDRFQFLTNTVDEAPTQAQVDVASGTTPYTLGFRKALKITNGNQTSVGAADAIYVRYRPEAQDIASSGWNYTSTSSFVTLSFWCKSSVAQNFFGVIETSDGTQKMFPFQTGSLSADTWTKVTITIPGHADLAFNLDNGQGLGINWVQFMGTDYTANSAVVNTWKAISDTERMPDNTSTWYTTNDATFEITGVQLEVSDFATSYDHKCYQEELYRCYRYYVQKGFDTMMASVAGNTGFPRVNYPVVMRAIASTYIQRNGTDHQMRNQNDGSSLNGISTYSHYDYGFAARGGGSTGIIYASTYYADAEL